MTYMFSMLTTISQGIIIPYSHYHEWLRHTITMPPLPKWIHSVTRIIPFVGWKIEWMLLNEIEQKNWFTGWFNDWLDKNQLYNFIQNENLPDVGISRWTESLFIIGGHHIYFAGHNPWRHTSMHTENVNAAQFLIGMDI